MSDLARHERLIDELVRAARPVRRLQPPLVKAGLWLTGVIAAGLLVAPFTDFDQLSRRLSAVPDMWLAVLGSSLTAILAAVATFQTSRPDRSPRWALLPLPAALLWIGASGLGCMRSWTIPGTQPMSMKATENCLIFIVGLSLPLSLLMVTMLRRSYALRPSLTAALGGLAAAAAAATLLHMIHPYDASAEDLAVHVFSVGAVVLGNRLLTGRALGRG